MRSFEFREQVFRGDLRGRPTFTHGDHKHEMDNGGNLVLLLSLSSGSSSVRSTLHPSPTRWTGATNMRFAYDRKCQTRIVCHFRSGSDSEKLAMSTIGPLCLEQLTQDETLEEFCVGPQTEVGSGVLFSASADKQNHFPANR
jgi:hypothetical protein